MQNGQQFYSREFLQGISDKRKQERIDSIIQSFILDLQNQAACGKTFYMYNTQLLDNRSRRHIPGGILPDPEIPVDDLLVRFRQKFPDCDVNYEETWVDQSNNTKVLKKGIMIDWS